MISVIIPVYNAGRIRCRFISAIKSVMRQSYQELEIICVNDGSTDNSEQIVKRLQKADDRIRLISKENGGVESARREGIAGANGRFVFHMDQDDILHPRALQILYECIEKCNADVAIANSARFLDILFLEIEAKRNIGRKKDKLIKRRLYQSIMEASLVWLVSQ